ncbi:MAG: feruloyl-CoA synthase [Rhizobiales bacterium]|nr:feruloyl-CoA synthase [Hyphomicrobiales bacterium]
MSNPLRPTRHDVTAPPVRAVRLGRPEVNVERKADGTIYLRSPRKLGPYPDKLTEKLVHWAKTEPDRVFMAQRDERGEWRKISYAGALATIRAIGESLLNRNLSADRPIAILSGNSLQHALLGLAANYIGVAYVPISPAYSLISQDFGKLRHIFNLLTPGLVFADDGAVFAKAIDAVVPPGVEIVVGRNQLPNRPMTLFEELTVMPPTSAVDAAHAKVGPDTIAKILFTSGSTGVPKGVINTQRMWCSNQEMLRTALAYFQDEPPVIVDWAPWHHTAGGNHDVGFVIYNGGTLYIDEGKPLPGAIETTVKNLRDVACTWYFTVPKGYEALIPFFRADAELRKTFFSRLKVLWFAGAALSQSVFDEMKRLAIETCGERILFLTGFGSTETAPFALGRTWESMDSANMGLPATGVELKLVPSGDKFEARVRGPSITPGYWREPKLTANAFDDEGFYKLGDALKFEDPRDPSRGLLFDGRIVEDFKLATGTWVSVGPLRARLLAHFEPFMRDVVIAGESRDELAILIFPNIDACRRLTPDLPAQAAPHDVCADPRVTKEFRFLLNSFAKTATGSSNRVCRAMLLAEPPSLDSGEMTDKGSINQRAVLNRRADIVEKLYTMQPSARLIAIDHRP